MTGSSKTTTHSHIRVRSSAGSLKIGQKDGDPIVAILFAVWSTRVENGLRNNASLERGKSNDVKSSSKWCRGRQYIVKVEFVASGITVPNGVTLLDNLCPSDISAFRSSLKEPSSGGATLNVVEVFSKAKRYQTV